MTLSCLKKYGIAVNNVDGAHRQYIIKGKQKYLAQHSLVEADWSQAAFWLVGGSIGEAINCTGVDFNSLQGDMAVVGNRPYLPREREDIGEYYNDIIILKNLPFVTKNEKKVTKFQLYLHILKFCCIFAASNGRYYDKSFITTTNFGAFT